MNDQQIERLIRNAEKAIQSSAFFGARFFGVISLLATPFLVAPGAVPGGAVIAGLSWVATYVSWVAGKDLAKEALNQRALVTWKEIQRVGALGGHDSAPIRDLTQRVGFIYELDPFGEILPLGQAIRLVLAWKQQQERLIIVQHHIQSMQSLKVDLLEKQKSLNELGDDNAALQPTLARLNADIGPLKRSREELRASCARLEALLSSVEVVARRRELHCEIGELAAQVPAGGRQIEPVFDTKDEQLDIERQITREIETFLQLERETDAHLRDL